MRRGLAIGLLGGLAACGGGGGGGMSGQPGGPEHAGPLPAVLDFLEPDSFLNGRVHETARTGIELVGGLRSGYQPTLDCGASQSPSASGHRIVWVNEATGERGETGVAVGCVDSGTIFGVGVRSRWRTARIDLAMGLNRIRLSTYQGGAQMGEDLVQSRRVDGVPPRIEYHYPAAEASGVPRDHRVLVRFSELMLETSLTPDRFQVSDSGDNLVDGAWHYQPTHRIWTFTPTAQLAAGARYRVTVRRGVRDVGGGGTLDEDRAWWFETGSGVDQASPRVVGVWPGEACECAPTSTRVLIAFDEPLLPASVATGALILRDAAGADVTGRTVSFGAFLAFLPDRPLQGGSSYRAAVATQLLDLAGHPLDAGHAWQFTLSDEPPQGRWQDAAPAPQPVQFAGGAWSGAEYLLWGAGDDGTGRGLRYDPRADRWAPMAHEIERIFDGTASREPFPESRRHPSVTWTGATLLVLGGEDAGGTPVFGGGAYDPVADAWSSIRQSWWEQSRGAYPSIAGLSHEASVWTGDELIVWGGRYRRGLHGPAPIGRGWRYDPARDVWTVMGPGPAVDENYRILDDPNAPSPRWGHSAVWTGGEMIVWGGFDAEGRPLGDGGRYDPTTEAWRPLAAAGAPPAAAGRVTTVWTGSRMLVWNGWNPANAGGFPRPNLRAYDPVADAWVATGSGWEPRFDGDAERSYVALWTGREMLVIGVRNAAGATRSTLAPFLYDPAADRWRAGVVRQWADSAFLTASWLEDEAVLFDGRAIRFAP